MTAKASVRREPDGFWTFPGNSMNAGFQDGDYRIGVRQKMHLGLVTMNPPTTIRLTPDARLASVRDAADGPGGPSCDPVLIAYATPCFLNHSSNRFQPSSA